jgi:Xaa-Pro dipeptidase
MTAGCSGGGTATGSTGAPSLPTQSALPRSLTIPRSNFIPRKELPPIPPLEDDVFVRRRETARALMTSDLAAKADMLFVASGSATFTYLVGADFGRSERLIALGISAAQMVLFAPSFEVSRIEKRARPGLKVVGWEENQDPAHVIRDVFKSTTKKTAIVVIAIDPHTEYGIVTALGRAMPDAKLVDGSRAFEDLRVTKTADEIVRMKRAIAITEDAFVATFDQLEVGMREKDVSKIAREEQTRRGGEGGYALVQFGESAAFPHGAPTSIELKKEMVVLMDGGCTFQGWNSDVTRTRWFGEKPSPRFQHIYNVVHDAQTAAMERVKPGVPAQEIDRAAREVIARAGFGPQFTHRLGHGIGLEGHEPIYIVEGNERALRPGMVFTIEPGIYLPRELGVRIEDQVMCTESGIEILTRRAPRL